MKGSNRTYYYYYINYNGSTRNITQKKEHAYSFLITLLLIFVATGIFIFNSPPQSATGYATYESLSSNCKKYFGDTICDDSPADCGSYYDSENSIDACDECQTYKDGKLGFDKCSGGADSLQTLSYSSQQSSCKDSCGSKSKTGTCWCDSVCSNQAPPDCCSDIATYCQDIVSTDPKLTTAPINQASTPTDKCAGYFGDTICDDSPADCGSYYDSENSIDACDECQTYKDGKLGFDKCSGGADSLQTLSYSSQQSSCKDSCGSKSKTGDCFCDKVCVNYGDCCSDIATYCQDIVSTDPKVTTAPTTKTTQSYSANYPVIFVHGWNGDLGSFDDMQNQLDKDHIAKDKGAIYSSTQCGGNWPKYTSMNFEYYENGKDKGIKYYADKLAKAIETLKSCTNSPEVTIVAHSMGGLISRTYIKKYGDYSVKKLIMLETPNYGAPLAWFASLAGGYDANLMVVGSGFLSDLNLNKAECSYRNKFVTVGSKTVGDIVVTWADAGKIKSEADKDVCAHDDWWESLDDFWKELEKYSPVQKAYASLVVPVISAKLAEANNFEIESCAHSSIPPEGPPIATPKCVEAYKIIKDNIK